MDRLSRYSFVLFLLVTAAAGADEPSVSEAEAREGFKLLFNGKDLTGFREVQGVPGSFWIEDGVLCGRRDGAKATAYWLSTEKKYADFEIKLEYKLEPGGNSGIFLRVPHYIGRTSTLGMECQLLDDAGKTGKPTDKETGSIYRVDPAEKFNSKPAGEWNDLAIRCVGSKVLVTLNGQVINDFDMTSNPMTAKRPREGYIGISAHTNVVRFRNIRLREIPPAEKS